MKNKKTVLGIVIALICLAVIVILLSTTGNKNKNGNNNGAKEEKLVVSYEGDVKVEKSREGIVTTQKHNDGDKAEFTIEGAQEGDSITFTYNVVNKTKNTAVMLDPPEMITEANNEFYTMISFSSEEALKANGGKGNQTIIVQVSQNPDEANKAISVTLNLTAQAAK